jgi:hypothetical protein
MRYLFDLTPSQANALEWALEESLQKWKDLNRQAELGNCSQNFDIVGGKLIEQDYFSLKSFLPLARLED